MALDLALLILRDLAGATDLAAAQGAPLIATPVLRSRFRVPEPGHTRRLGMSLGSIDEEGLARRTVICCRGFGLLLVCLLGASFDCTGERSGEDGDTSRENSSSTVARPAKGYVLFSPMLSNSWILDSRLNSDWYDGESQTVK